MSRNDFFAKRSPSTASRSHPIYGYLTRAKAVIHSLAASAQVPRSAGTVVNHLLRADEHTRIMLAIQDNWKSGAHTSELKINEELYGILMLREYAGRIATGTPQLTGIMAFSRQGIAAGNRKVTARNGAEYVVVQSVPGFSALAGYFADWSYAIRMPHTLCGLRFLGTQYRYDSYDTFLAPIFIEEASGCVVDLIDGPVPDAIVVGGYAVLNPGGIAAVVLGDGLDIRMKAWNALYDRLIEEQLHPYMAGAVDGSEDAYTRRTNRGPEDSIYLEV